MPLSRAAAIAALPAALLLAAGTASAQPRCAEVTPKILLRLDMKPAALSRARSIADLQRDSKNPRRDWHTMGLYHADVVHHSELEYRIGQAGDWICVAVLQVRVIVEMTTRVVYVARDLDRASCRYRVTLEHERQHEEIDEVFLRERLPREVHALRDQFAALATPTPVRVAEQDRTLQQINVRLKAVVDRMLERFFAERATAQAAIDTPEEYDRFSALCP